MFQIILEKIKRYFRKGELSEAMLCKVAGLTKQNTAEAYDALWGQRSLLKYYLEPLRVDGYRMLADFFLEQPFGNKILEVGFGSADFLKILVEKASPSILDVHGLDYAESGVKRARILIPKGKFVHGDIYALPYPTDYFDQIICMQTLEHLKEPYLAVKEMDRVCKQDGRLLITVPNGDLDHFEGHIHFWSEEAFKEFLSPRIIFNFLIYNNNRSFMVSAKPLK